MRSARRGCGPTRRFPSRRCRSQASICSGRRELENQRRGLQGFTQGVTASGVTLFVPASIVAGSSNNLFMLDNDTGHMIWSRRFEGPLPASTGPCTGGITAAPTRIVNAAAEPTPSPGAATAPPPPAQQGYRSSLGEPGQGIPVEPRGGPGRGGPPGRSWSWSWRSRRTGSPSGPAYSRSARPRPSGGLGRPMVAYAVAGDGQLHVVGLQSGKDLQKPAPFLPANSQWSNPVAVGTMMYAATSGNCAGAPNGVYAIDLDAADKPVVSYRTNGGSVVGSVAFSSDGNTLIAAIGPGSVTADGKANAIVALDPKTLKLKDWFTQPAAEFVTGPTVFRHGAKDVVAAATRDGRVILLDVASLGGANHATPLMASQSLVASGGSIAAEALATWARAAAERRLRNGGSRPDAGRPADARANGSSAPARSSPSAWRRPRVCSRWNLSGQPTISRRRPRQSSSTASCSRCPPGRAWLRHGTRIPGGALCLRWRVGQGTLEQRQGDGDLCVTRQLLERPEPGLRRH